VILIAGGGFFFGYGVVGLSSFAIGLLALRLCCFLMVLAFPCFLIGLFVLPLCGAAPTFLCRRVWTRDMGNTRNGTWVTHFAGHLVRFMLMVSK
jgi:hypothetical protein